MSRNQTAIIKSNNIFQSQFQKIWKFGFNTIFDTKNV